MEHSFCLYLLKYATQLNIKECLTYVSGTWDMGHGLNLEQTLIADLTLEMSDILIIFCKISSDYKFMNLRYSTRQTKSNS